VDEWRLVLARGYVATRRVSAGGARPPLSSRQVARPITPASRIAEGGQSSRSRNRVQRLLLSLPLEMLGDRAAMVTLTYPGDWRTFVKDGEQLAHHRRLFEDRWRHRFGKLMGLWFVEFQARGAPHLHLFLRLPDVVTAEEFEGLRARTALGRRLAGAHGKFDGRRRVPPIGEKYGSDFAMWLRTAWAEIVSGNTDRAHHRRGVDVRAMDYRTDREGPEPSRARVAAYLAAEASKRSQKKPPEGFGDVSHYYGVWGRSEGFCEQTTEMPVSEAVHREIDGASSAGYCCEPL